MDPRNMAAGAKFPVSAWDAVSGDRVAESGWQSPVGYGLSVDQMHHLGLHRSGPRSRTRRVR